MEKRQESRLYSKINKEVPVNLPTREEIIENSHLSETVFDGAKYQEYVKSFESRVHLLREQETHLRSDFDALRPFYAKGSDVYKQHADLVERRLSALSSDIHSVLYQKDLFPHDKNWFLAESQIDALSTQVRDMKYAMANLYSIGTYHSITLPNSASLHDQIGPGQYARPEIATEYARSFLDPRDTEKYFAGLLPSVENVQTESILTANGMAALTTVLALVKSEKSNGKYLIASNAYYELTKAFQHMLSELGKRDFTFYSPETLLVRVKEDDPAMVFVEPVQNNPDMREIDVLSLVSMPTKHDKRFVIIDDTLSGPNFDMDDIIKKSDPHSILLIISSLHKMCEQGDDVAPAGVIHVVGKNTPEIKAVVEKLRALRSILGTNITIPSLLLLQKIPLDAVKEYSSSIGKNVVTLTRGLQRIESPIIRKITAASENESGVSRGLVLHINFTRNVAARFMADVLAKARERELQVMARGAFGFRHTSMSIVGDESIVRIAPGIENARQLEVLNQIFEEVIENLARNSE